MFDLGFVSAILSGKKLPEVLEFASEEGFSCVEVMCWPSAMTDERRYAGVTHIDADNFNATAIMGMMEKSGVYISGLGYYPNPLDPDDSNASRFTEHILKLFSVAKELEIPVVNTFIGRDPARNIDYNLDRFREVWPPLIRQAASLGIRVGIENCPMLFTADEWPGGKNLAISPEIWDKMFEAIPDSNFGLNYDPSHLVWMQMDEIQPIFDFADRLHHIHLKDVKVYRDKLNRHGILAYPLQFHSPKIPGYGDVRWPDFFSALSSVGYRGPVCIEVEDKAFESSEDDIRSALVTSRNYLSQFLG